MNRFSVPPLDIVKVGFIGLGYRGLLSLERYTRLEGVGIVAICDCDRQRLNAARDVLECPEMVCEYTGADGWKRLCENPEIDLVYICTDWNSHAEIACHAMECGKHVAVEVPAATTVEECFALVRTSKRTGRHCMMLENCIYDVFEMATYHMARAGVFGEVYHAEGGYIHNIPQLALWRSDFNKEHRGDNYPTHGIAPLCRLMGIGSEDSLKTITSFSTSVSDGSHIVSIIRTEKGRTIILQHNIQAATPYTRLYRFIGEKGSVSKYPDERISMLPDASLWLSEAEMSALIDKYLPDYYSHVHQIVPENTEARRLMDYVMDYRLIYCLRNGLPLDMDVYEAAQWSCISELSHISVENGSATVAFPDFTAK